VNGFAFRRRHPRGLPSMDREHPGQDGRQVPGAEPLQSLARVLAAARLGDAVQLRAACNCGIEDLQPRAFR